MGGRPHATATQATVAEVWCRVLRAGSATAADNFFELGGGSLDAATMLALINAEVGVRIGLAEFFELPTLEDFARRIDQKRGDTRDASSPLRLTVPLRLSPKRLSPLVMVHPLGGSALSYRTFVDALACANSVYGVMAPGIEDNHEPLTSIEDMAEVYAGEIERMPADAAPVLGGWSFGAHVAYETAVRLEQRGRAPRAILMFDPRAPRRVRPWQRRADPLWRQIQQAWNIEADEDELRSMEEDQRYARLTALGIDQQRLPREMTVDLVVRRTIVGDLNARALRAYRPKSVYRHSAHVFRVTGDGIRARRGISRRWRRWLRGPVAYHDVPGTHDRMMEPPAVDELARRVELVLTEVTAS
jgi:thioesterase domain-containing protein/acyl carrier protein